MTKVPQPELKTVINPPLALTIVHTGAVMDEMVYVTITENNFGSLHHVTMSRELLRATLVKIDLNRSNNMQVTTGSVWEDYPMEGFVTIWEWDERRKKKRSVSITCAQFQLLLDYFFKE